MALISVSHLAILPGQVVSSMLKKHVDLINKIVKNAYKKLRTLNRKVYFDVSIAKCCMHMDIDVKGILLFEYTLQSQPVEISLLT